jgi:hypothetical protein
LQFGFQPGLGCGHALSAVVSVLLDGENSGESVALGIHDIRRAFDSIIHEQIVLEMAKRGVQYDPLFPLRDMYENLKAERVKIKCEKQTDFVRIPVKKGARQGAPTSAPAFNNSVIPAQESYLKFCISKSLDLSLVCFADDLLNIARELGRIEENFKIFEREYAAIGLEFIPSKSKVLLSNWPETLKPESITLGNTNIAPADHITYLGLPIGQTLKHTRALLIKHLEKRTSFAYSKMVAKKFSFNRMILARLYNALVLPHFLYLSPVWQTFPQTTKHKLRSIFFKYTKYLQRFPPWTRNTYLIRKYKIADPTLTIEKQIQQFNREITSHQWHAILQQ